MIKMVEVTQFNTVVVKSVNFLSSIVYYPNLGIYEVVKHPMGEAKVVMSTESGRFAKEMAKEIDSFFNSAMDDFLELTGWYSLPEPLL